jgi:hypothetical protein
MSEYKVVNTGTGCDFTVRRKGVRKGLSITGTDARNLRSVMKKCDAKQLQDCLATLWTWAERNYKI